VQFEKIMVVYKKGAHTVAGGQPLVARLLATSSRQRAVVGWGPGAGWWPAVARLPQVDTWQIMGIQFFAFLKFIFWLSFSEVWWMGQGFWDNRCTPPLTIFWSLPLHLEALNVLFLMEIGDFTFFSNFIFSKFRVHLDFCIYYWDVWFMKNWDH
jgi:hypothetical protein